MKHLLYFFFSVSLALADDTPLDEFTAGNQLFTQDVYNQLLLDNNDNILVSSFSAETVLALTQSGARGATAEEIRTTLHLASTEEETEREFKSVLPNFHSDYVTLVTANKIYVENNFPIREDFKKVANDVYQAEFQNIDFVQSKEAAEQINEWVAEETNNKITDLVKADDLDESTKIVLVNALYFKGNWSAPFTTLFTRQSQFFTSTDNTIEVTMMYQQAASFNYYNSEELDAQILELPFVGGEATMTFILPNQKEGIAVLEKQIQNVLAKPQYKRRMVQVMLPKFKIESSIDVKSLLLNLGVHRIFNSMEADLSGIAGTKGDLFVAQAKQKTFIDVNEGGVEAAAATEVGGIAAGVPQPQEYFIADHPFVFYIKFHDIVLFEGRVVLPKY